MIDRSDWVTCTKCGWSKPPIHFGKSGSKDNGKQSWCKTCCKTRLQTAKNYADYVMASLGNDDRLI